LIHDNESNNIEDKFKFEDINNIHYLDWIEEQNNIKANKDKDNINFIDTNNIIDSYSNEINNLAINDMPSNSETIIVTGKNKKVTNIDDLDDLDNLGKLDKLDNLDNLDNFDETNIDLNNFTVIE
jgi:hypothetical protein